MCSPMYLPLSMLVQCSWVARAPHLVLAQDTRYQNPQDALIIRHEISQEYGELQRPDFKMSEAALVTVLCPLPFFLFPTVAAAAATTLAIRILKRRISRLASSEPSMYRTGNAISLHARLTYIC